MAKLKAVVFDLDDTLFDCTGQLVQKARADAARAMVKAGLPLSVEKTVGLMREIREKEGPKALVFDRLADRFAPEKKRRVVDAALKAYHSEDVGPIRPFADTIPLLRRLRETGLWVAVLTSGLPARQWKKIRALGLETEVDQVIVHDVEKESTKDASFSHFLKQHRFRPSQVVVVGDQIHSEIRIGNQFGMTTIRVLHGHYSKLKPKNDLEHPDYSIKRVGDAWPIVDRMVQGKNGKPAIVVVGGGTGLATLLRGLRGTECDLTAIVTVTDSGRSTGVLRREFNVPAPGDIRNCLVALSDSPNLKTLFDYRFSDGSLAGMSLGNLFLTALAKTTGSFERAIEESARILNVRGTVLASTLENVHLGARLSNGTVLKSEDALVARHGAPEKRAPIERVFLIPKGPKANPRAVRALLKADVIVLGPGSLFSSVISNLCIPGIVRAIRKSRAKKVLVCNAMTQPSQTHKYDAADHVAQVERYAGKGVLDAVIYNTKKPSAKLLRHYAREQSFFVKPPLQKTLRPRWIGANLIEKDPEMAKLWEKKNLLRHDSKKIARILQKLATDSG